MQVKFFRPYFKNNKDKVHKPYTKNGPEKAGFIKLFKWKARDVMYKGITGINFIHYLRYGNIDNQQAGLPPYSAPQVPGNSKQY